MSLFDRFFDLIAPKKKGIKDVYRKFLNGGKKIVFTVIFDKAMLGMIEHIENLNKIWFQKLSVEIPYEKGYFITITIPKILPDGLELNSKFSKKSFLETNDFFISEESEQFTSLGKFYSKDVNPNDVLYEYMDFFNEVFFVEDQEFNFNIMKTS